MHLKETIPQSPTTHPPGRVSIYCSATLAFPLQSTKASCFSKPFRLTHYIRSTASLSLTLPFFVWDMASTSVIGFLVVLFVLQPWIALSYLLPPLFPPVSGLLLNLLLILPPNIFTFLLTLLSHNKAHSLLVFCIYCY